MKTVFRCPECQSQKLQVQVEVWACLLQEEDNFETVMEGGEHYWDETHPMRCRHCRFTGGVQVFRGRGKACLRLPSSSAGKAKRESIT